MPVEYLFDPASKEDALKFRKAWNTRHGIEFGPCRLRMAPHDFGAYPEIVMDEEKFYAGIDHGIEDKVIALADELGLEY